MAKTNPVVAARKRVVPGVLVNVTYSVATSPWSGSNPDGTPHAGSLAEVNTITPTSLISDAHKAGLFVHAYTFRSEQKYLAGSYHGDPAEEYKLYFRAGVDGVFSDFANTGVLARTEYLKESGRKGQSAVRLSACSYQRRTGQRREMSARCSDGTGRCGCECPPLLYRRHSSLAPFPF